MWLEEVTTAVFIATVNDVQEASGYFPREPYQHGRFSNGPIYLETAAASVGKDLDSFATGAAVTGAPGSSAVLPVYPPYDSLSQVVNVAVPTGLQQVRISVNLLPANAAVIMQ